MLRPRLNTVFASRWKAVLWSVSILLFALRMVPSAEETKASKARAVQVDPWALDKPGTE
ncbi:hypothetical protein [Novosphingobium sp. AAP83]|uniref:hypothetical protein n=1 Tax=Novosphingobium sp. AAP83 TaxID=1523425 RepID=UPI000AC506D3|nr:hypothetical protein [Novosphingobium sp. AAP83]